MGFSFFVFVFFFVLFCFVFCVLRFIFFFVLGRMYAKLAILYV